MTVDAEPDGSGWVGGVVVGEPTLPTIVPSPESELESPAPPRVPWWQRHLLVLLVVVALLAGSAGALITDSLRGNTKASTTTPPATAARSAPLGPSLQGADIVASVEPAVVTIEVELSQQTRFGTTTVTAAGTGIILTASGLVATNAHVVAGANSITVALTGQSATRSARLVAADESADLALLQIAGTGRLPTVRLGDSSSVRAGDDVLAIGNALDLEGGLTVSRGIVSALNRSVQTQSTTMTGLIQTDAAISSGNSGGPLLNGSGQLIGIDTLAMTSTRGTTAENIGFAIPINQALTVLHRLGFTQTGS